jgi:Acyl-coenzyme A:6-aminopenicillanic acid acyl-transferase
MPKLRNGSLISEVWDVGGGWDAAAMEHGTGSVFGDSYSRRLAGDPGDFVAVSHLTLSGSQAEIGSGLARAAIAMFGAVPRAIEPALERARRRWDEANWPEQHDRRRGMAAVFGVAEEDPSLCIDDLHGFPVTTGCSAVWCPPGTRTDAAVVRNFDIHTSVIHVPEDDGNLGRAALSRPHVVQLHPARGMSSVSITGNNLNGCLEGINEAGLCVVELADGQSAAIRPTGSPQAGLDESQLPRFLLDRCATVAQAREALYEAKHYTRYSSCHFLVADAHEQAFVWERDGDNAEHIVDAATAPLIVTNHLLAPGTAPHEQESGDSRGRHQALLHQLQPGPATIAAAHTALDTVRAENQAIRLGSRPELVTLWRTQYDPGNATMTIRFLLGTGPDQRYSDTVTLTAQ